MGGTGTRIVGQLSGYSADRLYRLISESNHEKQGSDKLVSSTTEYQGLLYLLVILYAAEQRLHHPEQSHNVLLLPEPTVDGLPGLAEDEDVFLFREPLGWVVLRRVTSRGVDDHETMLHSASIKYSTSLHPSTPLQ